ncbi:hypothetical protein [uncultured Aquimarina sp.]|nr:hypothetical protein [uncultured Aquimarina sp.]
MKEKQVNFNGKELGGQEIKNLKVIFGGNLSLDEIQDDEAAEML